MPDANAPAAAQPQAPATPEAEKPLRASMAERLSALGKDPNFSALVKPTEAAPDVPKPEPEKPAAETKPSEEPRHQTLQRLAQMEREKRALEEELKTLKPRASAEEELRKLAASNPAEAAKRLGISIEALLDLQLNGGQPTLEAKTKAVEDELRKEIDALKKARETDEKRTQEAAAAHARQTWRTETGKLITPESHPHLHALGEKFGVMDTVEEVFQAKVTEYAQKLGRPLSREDAESIRAIRDEAVKSTEGYYQGMREALLTIGQVATDNSAQGSSTRASSAAAIPSQQAGQRRTSPTLTNSVSSPAPPGTTRHLSMKERERALARGLSQLPQTE